MKAACAADIPYVIPLLQVPLQVQKPLKTVAATVRPTHSGDADPRRRRSDPVLPSEVPPHRCRRSQRIRRALQRLSGIHAYSKRHRAQVANMRWDRANGVRL